MYIFCPRSFTIGSLYMIVISVTLLLQLLLLLLLLLGRYYFPYLVRFIAGFLDEPFPSTYDMDSCAVKPIISLILSFILLLECIYTLGITPSGKDPLGEELSPRKKTLLRPLLLKKF